MSVIQTSFTASAAIATNGTTTFSYPTRWGNTPDVTTQGDFYGSYGHMAFIESMQALISSPANFTLTFGNSTITFTYLGTTTIPAGSVIRIDLHTSGQTGSPRFAQAFPFAGSPGDQASQANSGPANILGVSTKLQLGGISYINFGTPLTASATAVVATSALGESAFGVVNTLATPVVLDVPRNLTYKSSSASDTTQTITVRGLDDYGQPLTETSPTLTGTTAVVGLKAFKTIISWELNVAVSVGTISIGSGVKLGVPGFVFSAAASLEDILNGAASTLGTWAKGDSSTPSATTGDVRGTYSPNTAPSTNTNTYESFVAILDPTYLGATQYAG